MHGTETTPFFLPRSALILSLIGIYGVVVYTTAMRRFDIGVRIALGQGRSKLSGWSFARE